MLNGQDEKTVVRTVFVALILDLLAFTMPLPLFPRLIAWYLQKESQSSSTLLARLLRICYSWRSSLTRIAGSSIGTPKGGKDWDVVLLGGAMGSIFSLCQCIISPWLGRLSDKYGRKKVLLATMMGNLLSAAVWLKSTTFSTYLLSRLIGGLSEGNVQLSTAIISDVCTPSTRSRSLALVGIAFSICFTLGPSIGAYFASRPIPLTTSSDWNVFALPAAISLGLLSLETLYLAFKLPETRDWKKSGKNNTVSSVQSEKNERKESADVRLNRIRNIGTLHGLFLLFFSGAEFTLTFLTYDLKGASNKENGLLLSYIGILSALIQGGYIRRSISRVGELKMASYGIFTCIISLLFLSFLPILSILSSVRTYTIVLYGSASLLAFTSASVVSSLTGAAASCCDEIGGDPRLQRGRALGGYRSRGQLGRAAGPILASSIYWVVGPRVCYMALAVSLTGIWLYSRGLAREEKRRTSGKTR